MLFYPFKLTELFSNKDDGFLVLGFILNNRGSLANEYGPDIFQPLDQIVEYQQEIYG
jgi:hypothetical protein